MRHSHECRATVVRIKMKIRYICGKVVRHSHECRATVVRQSRDYRATVVRYIFKLDRNLRICRINVYSMRLQHESFVYIVNLCRVIVANYSRTSLRLSCSSEIGALDLPSPIIYVIFNDLESPPWYDCFQNLSSACTLMWRFSLNHGIRLDSIIILEISEIDY